MPLPGIDQFKSRLQFAGARACLFRVTIPGPPAGSALNGLMEEMSFMVKATTPPGSKFETIQVPFMGRMLKLAGERSFEDWKITVYNETNMPIRNAFEQWMANISAHATPSGLTNLSAYSSDLRVTQLDRSGIPTKSYTLSGAFPTDISSIELNYETNNAIETFDVTFAYQYWNTLEVPETLL